MEECEGERVAYDSGAGAMALSSTSCKDAARKEPVLLLHEDAAISDVDGCATQGGTTAVRMCNHHACLYEAQRSRRQCAKDGCHHHGKHERDGIRLCATHAQGRGVTWRPRSRSPATPRKAAPRQEAQAAQTHDDKCWIAFVRDPEAPLAVGLDAYFRYEAELGDEVLGAEGDLLQRKVKVPELELGFIVPVGCMRELERGESEFWGTALRLYAGRCHGRKANGWARTTKASRYSRGR